MTTKKQTTQAMRRPGTSLMQALYSEHVVGALRGYACSECNIEVHCPIVDTELTFFRPMQTHRWKYCAGCGREIARFAEHPERKRRRLAAMFWNRDPGTPRTRGRGM